jgi:hypothetical protein
MRFILFLSIIGCFPELNNREESFPDNPLHDYDQDFMTEQQGDCDDINPDVTNGPWYQDSDGDGYGDPNNFTSDCLEKEHGRFVLNKDDCNDSETSIFPGSARFEPTICADDQDGDGYGDAAPAKIDYDTELRLNGTKMEKLLEKENL